MSKKTIIIILFTIMTTGILSGCGTDDHIAYKEAKESYDTWFYCWTEKYNGVDIHIDSRIKSVNLKSSANISGNLDINGLFIVGRGQIGSQDYYYIYQEIGPNTYVLVKMPADETKILETDEISPSIAAEYNFEYNKCLYYDWKRNEHSFTKNNLIIVPKGTIIQQFNL